MTVPSDLKYTATHEWVREEAGVYTVGITDHAQQLLGDLVFVELPEMSETSAGNAAGVVESVKAASDLYSPLSGEIVEVNERLRNEPELINADPYGDGWIFRIRFAPMDEWKSLMSATEYTAHVAAEAH